MRLLCELAELPDYLRDALIEPRGSVTELKRLRILGTALSYIWCPGRAK
jgi:hypothetical protein